MSTHKHITLQKWVVVTASVLFVLKLLAYFLTHSVSILTDALESTVNMAAGLISLYSLYIAAKPRDVNHPYGHGKAEFLSAAVEGTLIGIAGIIILVEAVNFWIRPRPVQKLDLGIGIICITALINYIVGTICIRNGKKTNSPALIASGKHLYSDTISTVGIVIGLILIYFTKLQWLDGVIAFIFGLIIIYTAYTILRSSIAGIMDEADAELLNKMVSTLNENRRENWVDLHNLRVIKYGSVLHIDCHLTVPWFLNVHEAHKEIEALGDLIRKEFGGTIEFFVHSDGCLPFSCRLCSKKGCPERKHSFERSVSWTLENVLSDQKHRLTPA